MTTKSRIGTPASSSRAGSTDTGSGSLQPSGTSAPAGPARARTASAAAPTTTALRRAMVSRMAVTASRISARPGRPSTRSGVERVTRGAGAGIAPARTRGYWGAMFALDTSDPCASGEQICEAAMNLTGNSTTAEIADVVIGKPLALAGLLLLALGAPLAAAPDGGPAGQAGRGRRPAGPRHPACRPGAATAPTPARPATSWSRTRRVQRAQTMGSLLKSMITGVVSPSSAP